MSGVPIPEPVPPPSEWVSWKPCRQSQLSAPFHIQDRVNQLSTLCVVAFGPVVACPRLNKNKVVCSEDLAKRT